MMHGRGKSSPVIVARKPANKADPDTVSAAESVERRAGAKGNANQHATYRTQCRARVVALASIRQAVRFDCQNPRWVPLYKLLLFLFHHLLAVLSNRVGEVGQTLFSFPTWMLIACRASRRWSAARTYGSS
jgi:hypothetical protein